MPKLKIIKNLDENCVHKFLFTLRHEEGDIWFDWKCEGCDGHLTQFMGIYDNPNLMSREELKKAIKDVK